MNTLLLSMKVFLISLGALSVAMGLKFSLPFAMNGIPTVWSVVLLWMKPPYLYIVINGIIITIAASSRFHQNQTDPVPARSSEHIISVKTPPPSVYTPSPAHVPEIRTIAEELTPGTLVVYQSDDVDRVVELKRVIVNGAEVEDELEDEAQDVFIDPVSAYDNRRQEIVVFPEHELAEAEAEDVLIDSTSTLTATYNAEPREMVFPERELESLYKVREKPLVSSRFGHRKPIRTSPEVSGMRALRVARPKRQETLESTWKMITEGRHVPLTRHLKKSDTFEHHVRHVTPPLDLVPKSETFKERGNNESISNSRIRKEPSLSQDELNRRVEAFIKKFNEDMRLQRQESLNQYMEMINRGV